MKIAKRCEIVVAKRLLMQITVPVCSAVKTGRRCIAILHSFYQVDKLKLHAHRLCIIVALLTHWVHLLILPEVQDDSAVHQTRQCCEASSEERSKLFCTRCSPGPVGSPADRCTSGAPSLHSASASSGHNERNEGCSGHEAEQKAAGGRSAPLPRPHSGAVQSRASAPRQ